MTPPIDPALSELNALGYIVADLDDEDATPAPLQWTAHAAPMRSPDGPGAIGRMP